MRRDKIWWRHNTVLWCFYDKKKCLNAMTLVTSHWRGSVASCIFSWKMGRGEVRGCKQSRALRLRVARWSDPRLLEVKPTNEQPRGDWLNEFVTKTNQIYEKRTVFMFMMTEWYYENFLIYSDIYIYIYIYWSLT